MDPINHQVDVVILAAGRGTRLKTKKPKVLHEIAGISLIGHVLRALEKSKTLAGVDMFYNMVLGHGYDQVLKYISSVDTVSSGLLDRKKMIVSRQAEQNGTAHAVQCALASKTSQMSGAEWTLIVSGDTPLISAHLLSQLIEKAKSQTSSDASLAYFVSTFIQNPTGYGRVERLPGGIFKIVEEKEADENQKKIKEINAGLYFVNTKILEESLALIEPSVRTGEYYLPAILDVIQGRGIKVEPVLCDSFLELQGINTLSELAVAQKTYRMTRNEQLMADGVAFENYETTMIGPDVVFGADCEIGEGSTLLGQCSLSDGIKIGRHCRLENVTLGSKTEILDSCVILKSTLGSSVRVGPFAHLRPGNEIQDHVRIGNFVELKETQIGAHTAVAHLSYLGDAQVGSECNIGCGFVTCNYDGRVIEGQRKHKTLIGDRVFMGSDCQVIAPIEIANGVYVGSGSTVSKSVLEEDSLVIARAKALVKPGYAKKYRQK